MIRFSPDTWFEAVMRPLAMALPQSWIYTEIMAPDMRFAALILALAIAAVLWLQGRRWMGDNRALVILLLVVAFSFPVWLLTGGNGRYFMAILLLVGPVLVAVWHRLPLQAAKKWMLMLLFAAMQVTAIAVNPPWDPFDTFEWVRWRDTGYFHLDTRAVADDKGVTYVTLPGQTNSLVAPLFPHESGWINLTSFGGQDFLSNQRPVVAEARRRLSAASDLRLLLRSQPREATPDKGLPNEKARVVIDDHLQPFGLKLSVGKACKLLPSQTFARMTPLVNTDTPAQIKWLKAHAGFWACPLEWSPDGQVVRRHQGQIPESADQAIRKIESMCPRLFPPGQTIYQRTGFGYERSYGESDSTVSYVRSSDRVYAKMFRALNPQSVGNVADILHPGFKLDCGGFVGREGLPWHRQI